MAKILIVEDEHMVRDAIKRKLESSGFEVLEAGDGQEGLQRAESGKPDLILLDLILPLMDGLTVLEKLRGSEWGKNIPVIVLSNLSDTKTVQESKQKGVFDFLVKTDWTLDDVVSKIREDPEDKVADLMKKILVAEDDQYLANAYRMKLVKSGYDVKIASDGTETMSLVDSYSPDILILDLIMPGKDGFSVLADLKKSPKYANLPVIVASNLGQGDDVGRAKKMGANDYVIKSDLSLAKLIEKIKNIVGE